MIRSRIPAHASRSQATPWTDVVDERDGDGQSQLDTGHGRHGHERTGARLISSHTSIERDEDRCGPRDFSLHTVREW